MFLVIADGGETKRFYVNKKMCLSSSVKQLGIHTAHLFIVIKPRCHN